jgi:predicted acyltransferase
MEKSLTPQRVSSVDAYRGFVMFLLLAEGLHLSSVAKAYPDNWFWEFMSFHQSHVPWIGCSLHDLIQPSFSFLVGVALPFSIASRIAKNQDRSTMWFHTIKRSLILIFLGVFLRSMHASQTNFTFEDTLSQIGLGYPVLFALGFARERVQWTSLAIILIGYFMLFAFYPLPGPDFDWSLAGVAADWEHHLSGFAAHWNKNTNPAWAFDQWFMNLFPREKEFLFNRGGYSTLSFITTLGTMILGLLAGQWLKNMESPGAFIKKCAITSACLMAAALLLSWTGLNPIVKRIWTPAWVLYSGAWCFLLLTLFYIVVDVKEKKSWFYFLIVIGSNSIAAYIIASGIDAFIGNSLRIHLGQDYDMIFGAGYRTLVSGSLVLLFEWLLLRWMYKKKIFIKI